MELSESPIKIAPYTIQVAEANFDYQGQQIQPDVKLKDLKDMSLFGTRQFDAIILQRQFRLVALEELKRVLKRDGKLILIQDQNHDLGKQWTLIKTIETLNLYIWERA